MSKSRWLLHPGYFDRIPLKGASLRKAFERFAQAASTSEPYVKDITVAIRTLNEADQLKLLLEDIKAQKFEGSIEVVIADNESSDSTHAVAAEYGVKVVTLPRNEFTYPKSMNLAVSAATNRYIFLTVGHARLLSPYSLQAGLNNFKQHKVSAVFGHALPSANASVVERLIAMANGIFMKKRVVSKPELGFMAATGLMFDKTVWEKLGKFDERFEIGGEDGALGVSMLKKGYTILDDPMLCVHHTHGLGLRNTVQQWIGWIRSSNPKKLNRSKLAKRRPDLKISK